MFAEVAGYVKRGATRRVDRMVDLRGVAYPPPSAYPSKEGTAAA